MTILILCLLLSFRFIWEDISNTGDSVSSAIQTPQISSKILRWALYFQLSSQCLDIPMKHSLSESCVWNITSKLEDSPVYHVTSARMVLFRQLVSQPLRTLAMPYKINHGIYRLGFWILTLILNKVKWSELSVKNESWFYCSLLFWAVTM